MGIGTVAVFSDPDRSEPHAREADEAIHLPGSTPTETYLNMNAVLAAAKQAGADAIHPGYGFLSENAEFARAVTDAGLLWIGPSPAAIEVMGSKLESKKLMAEAGVPTLESIEVAPDGSLPDHDLPYPILVKASAGGGGKGMRIVSAPDELDEAIAGAQREAESSFGDGTVFLERYLTAPRHIEIQVFGDTHGTVVSLYERECSIQRRHQKIVEEAPSPAIGPELRERMGDAAVAAAEAVDYVGAGTVEFLFQDGEFFFLEMNTRLQVEHPVTEMVTGLDLVALQFDVAGGGRVPDDPPPPYGHAIEARLYAEDPRNEYLPVTGTFHRFEFPEIGGLRVDAGIDGGSVVSVHYDPMIAKVISHADTRERAASILADALRRAAIHGSTTNRSLLVRILEHPEFLEGDTDTHFLLRNDIEALAGPLLDETAEVLAAVAAAAADQALERSQTPVLATIPSGWRNSPSQPQLRSYAGEFGEHEVGYDAQATFHVRGLGRVTILDSSQTTARLSFDGETHRFAVGRYGALRYVDTDRGSVRLTALPRYPDTAADEDAGSLHAPMPGKVLRIDVEAGDRVADGQTLVVMEAMKMEHTLKAPHDGSVTEIRCEPDDQVEAGAILIVVEEA